MTTNDSQERGSRRSPSANADKHGFCLLSAGICVAKHQRHPRSNRSKNNDGEGQSCYYFDDFSCDE